MQLSIFSLAEHHAKPFRSQDCVRAWLTHEETSLSLILESLIATVPMPNGKPTADGPRYKALGNSMAVNVMRWIGRRIELIDKVAAEALSEAAE